MLNLPLSENFLAVTGVTGTTEQVRLTAPLTFTIVFLGSETRPATFTHRFALLPLPADDGYGVLLGTDLFARILPAGVPSHYYCTPVNGHQPAIMDSDVEISPSKPTLTWSFPRWQGTQPRPAHVFHMTAAALSQMTHVSSGGEGAEPAPETSIANKIAELAAMPLGSSGVIGELPSHEQPERLVVDHDPTVENEEGQRQQAMDALRTDLEANAAITGFCTVPEAVCTLDIDVDRMKHPYRHQYPIPKAV